MAYHEMLYVHLSLCGSSSLDDSKAMLRTVKEFLQYFNFSRVLTKNNVTQIAAPHVRVRTHRVEIP
jgi:hypothetical protein